jgi:tRNA modification GTPase
VTGAGYGGADPIAALATPPGESALAQIRASGENALELFASIFSSPEKIKKAPGNSVVHGRILKPVRREVSAGPAAGACSSGTSSGGTEGREIIDEVLVSVFRAPRSYTGEDCLDISCHGGSAVVKAVMEALRETGFRDSLPGEFTFRAFINGKLDLTRAESVMELVSAKTGAGRGRAVNRLSGALEVEIRELRDLLVQVLAGTELRLDYSEDEGDAGGEGLPDRPLAEAVLERLQALAASYRMERLYQEGALGVIAGRPNAGKSSLFNRLVKEDRSIVTDIPGTTRDWIEAWISLGGIPLRLADTAGLRDSPDEVEQLGMARSRELLAAADLVLYVIDGCAGFTGEDRRFLESLSGPGAPPPLLLWNKADAVPPPAEGALLLKPGTAPFPLLAISAKTGEGAAALCAAMTALLEDRNSPEGGNNTPGIASARQKGLIDGAAAAVEEALDLADRGEPLDLIAPLLREGVNALGEITGEVSTADILEAVFSRFCVGK